MYFLNNHSICLLNNFQCGQNGLFESTEVVLFVETAHAFVPDCKFGEFAKFRIQGCGVIINQNFAGVLCAKFVNRDLVFGPIYSHLGAISIHFLLSDLRTSIIYCIC